MRILALIARYPPHHLGGYELRFEELVGGLRTRGHEVTVVCSSWRGGPGGPAERDVRRVLTLPGEVHGVRGVVSLARGALRDHRALRAAFADAGAQVVLCGDAGVLCSALWNGLSRARVPVVLDVSNGWLLDLLENHGNWFRIFEKPSRSRLRGVLKTSLRLVLDRGPRALRTRWPGLRAAAVYTTAEHLLDRLRVAAERGLIPAPLLCRSGIELGAFPLAPAPARVESLLFVGRMKPQKGLHTALAALALLPPQFRLTVVTLPGEEAYEGRMRARAAEADLQARITFERPRPRTEMAGLLRRHDALLFPSEGEEAFSRLVLEAMACGRPVVATPCGGTREVVGDGETGLLFPPGDAAALAACVRRLASEPGLRERLVSAARRSVETSYRATAMIDRVEAVLRGAAEVSR